MPAWFGGYSGQGNGDWAGPWTGPSVGPGSAPTSTGGGMFSGGFGPSPYSGGNGGYGGTPPLGVPGGTASAAPSFNPYPQPNEGGTAWGSRPGFVGLPDPAGDLGRQIPGLAGLNAAASRNLAEGFAGVLPGDVIAQIQDASARFGIESGMPGSGLSRNRGLRQLGLTSLGQQRDALAALPGFLSAVSGTQTVNPALQAQIARDNATIASAPNPRAAANEAERLFAKYRQSTSPGGGTRGGGGGFPGFSLPGYSSPAGGTMAGPSYSPSSAPAPASGPGYGYAPTSFPSPVSTDYALPGGAPGSSQYFEPTGGIANYDPGLGNYEMDPFMRGYLPDAGADFGAGGAPTATGNTDPFYNTFTGSTDQDFEDWMMGWGGGG